MRTSVAQYRKELLREIEEIPTEKIKDVLDFVYFIKTKEAIDPSQSYFWTKKWQDMEKEVYMDKKAGNIIGNGTVKDLLKKLKK